MTDVSQLRISARLLAEEAERQGFTVELIVDDFSFMRLRRDDFTRPFLLRSTVTEMTGNASGLLCDNKWVFYHAMQKAGISVPETQIIYPNSQDPKAVVSTMLKRHNPLVIKPVDSRHGQGVSIGITSVDQALEAIDRAKPFALNGRCLVQEQRRGNDYRFLIVNGKFIAAAGRRPAFVSGDGTSTVAELIDTKNTDPLRGDGHSSPLTKIDVDLVIAYNSADILQKIPKSGEDVQLLPMANLSKGGEAIDINDTVHPELKEMACAVAKEVQAGVCGVDILTNDPTMSIQEGGAVVIEANQCPGIRMHHFPSQGNSVNAAKIIIDEMVAQRRKILTD